MPRAAQKAWGARLGRAVAAAVFCVALVTPARAHAAQPFGAGTWVVVCAFGGMYRLNLATGERRSLPDDPGAPDAEPGCHNVCLRRKQTGETPSPTDPDESGD